MDRRRGGGGADDLAIVQINAFHILSDSTR